MTQFNIRPNSFNKQIDNLLMGEEEGVAVVALVVHEHLCICYILQSCYKVLLMFTLLVVHLFSPCASAQSVPSHDRRVLAQET